MDGDPVARGQGEQRLLYHFRVGVRPHGAGDDSRTQLGVSGQRKNRGDLFGAARRAEPIPADLEKECQLLGELPEIQALRTGVFQRDLKSADRKSVV